METQKRKQNSPEKSPRQKIPKMKLKTIEKLPRESLQDIMRHVGNRREAALVCKEFYSAVCDVDNSEDIYKLVFNQFIDDLQIQANSIFHSKRKISEIELTKVFFDDAKFLTFAQIFIKFSFVIKKVTMNKCLISENQLCELLSVTKNLEELSMINCRIKHYNKTRVNFKLCKVKKLSFADTKFRDVGITQSTKNNAITNLLSMVVENSPLESFECNESFVNFFPFTKVKLNHLKIDNAIPRGTRLGSLVEMQFNLNSLDLMDCFIMDDTLVSIKKSLDSLKVLKINLSGVSCDGFTILQSLLLSELHLIVGKTKWITNSIVESNFSTITSLYINVEELMIEKESFEHMLRQFTNLKKLHVKTNLVDIISVIFNRPNRLQSCTVEFSYMQEPHYLSILAPKLRECFPLLKAFNVINRDPIFARRGDFSFLRFFNKLEKLKVDGFIINQHLHKYALMHIHLTHLELIETSVSNNVEYVFDNSLAEVFKSFANNLKFMKIDCSVSSFLKEHSELQFPVEFRRGKSQVYRSR